MSFTVTAGNSINQYTASEGQTVFSYVFEIFADVDLDVYVDDALQTLGTNYTVQGAGATGGGTITFTVGRTAGEVITIDRQIPIERIGQFQAAQGFRAPALNSELDRLFMIAQQIDTAFRLRGFAVPVTTLLSGVVTELPAPSAGKFLRWNGAGTQLVNSDGTVEDSGATTSFIDSFNASEDAAEARAVLGLGTASQLNQGTGASQVPLNSALGTAAFKDVGLSDDDIPVIADINPNCIV